MHRYKFLCMWYNRPNPKLVRTTRRLLNLLNQASIFFKIALQNLACCCLLVVRVIILKIIVTAMVHVSFYRNNCYNLWSIIRKSTNLRRLSTTSGKDEWNDTWETAWLPEDLKPSNTRAPWETDVNFSVSESLDPDTKAFVEDMTDNWDNRRKKGKTVNLQSEQERLKKEGKSLYSLENVKRDYRVQKQRVHAGLWAKEIDKMEEAKLGDSVGADDLDKFLDTASEIFESDLNNNNNKSKVKEYLDLKNKADGWETTSKGGCEDQNIWEMSQREEDILLQEYERRIAFSKFQIGSFIKQHIFSRRRPIDGWKYMIEELGPNARRGGKSVTRLPSLADPATQPFKEEIPAKGTR